MVRLGVSIRVRIRVRLRFSIRVRIRVQIWKYLSPRLLADFARVKQATPVYLTDSPDYLSLCIPPRRSHAIRPLCSLFTGYM